MLLVLLAEILWLVNDIAERLFNKAWINTVSRNKRSSLMECLKILSLVYRINNDRVRAYQSDGASTVPTIASSASHASGGDASFNSEIVIT